MMSFFSSGCLTLKVTAWQIFYLRLIHNFDQFCLTTRRNCFLTAAHSCRRGPRRIPGARGETPLHDAAGFGHAAVVELLISAGATVDAANNNGRGPGRVFQVAFRSGADEVTGRGLYIGR